MSREPLAEVREPRLLLDAARVGNKKKIQVRAVDVDGLASDWSETLEIKGTP